jgi:AbrB family looped-hinge helix DNA binding protein
VSYSRSERKAFNTKGIEGHGEKIEKDWPILPVFSLRSVVSTRFASRRLTLGMNLGRIFLPGKFMAARRTGLEYLTTTKIGEKGQLTVPKSFRKDLGLGNGAPFAVLRLGDGLILLPEQHRFQQLCDQIGEALMAAGIEPDDALGTLPEARKRVFERRYGHGKPAQKGLYQRSRSRRMK